MADQVDDDDYVAPVTPLEQELCAMWQELTANSDIGTADHFFDVGGHSLLAAEVVARTREKYAVRLPLRWCVDHPTVSDLAAMILAEQRRTESVAGGGGPAT